MPALRDQFGNFNESSDSSKIRLLLNVKDSINADLENLWLRHNHMYDDIDSVSISGVNALDYLLTVMAEMDARHIPHTDLITNPKITHHDPEFLSAISGMIGDIRASDDEDLINLWKDDKKANKQEGETIDYYGDIIPLAEYSKALNAEMHRRHLLEVTKDILTYTKVVEDLQSKSDLELRRLFKLYLLEDPQEIDSNGWFYCDLSSMTSSILELRESRKPLEFASAVESKKTWKDEQLRVRNLLMNKDTLEPNEIKHDDEHQHQYKTHRFFPEEGESRSTLWLFTKNNRRHYHVTGNCPQYPIIPAIFNTSFEAIAHYHELAQTISDVTGVRPMAWNVGNVVFSDGSALRWYECEKNCFENISAPDRRSTDPGGSMETSVAEDLERASVIQDVIGLCTKGYFDFAQDGKVLDTYKASLKVLDEAERQMQMPNRNDMARKLKTENWKNAMTVCIFLRNLVMLKD